MKPIEKVCHDYRINIVPLSAYRLAKFRETTQINAKGCYQITGWRCAEHEEEEFLEMLPKLGWKLKKKGREPSHLYTILDGRALRYRKAAEKAEAEPPPVQTPSTVEVKKPEKYTVSKDIEIRVIIPKELIEILRQR